MTGVQDVFGEFWEQEGPGWGVYEFGLSVHSVPVFEGEPTHVLSGSCWCEPECEWRGIGRTVGHRRVS